VIEIWCKSQRLKKRWVNLQLVMWFIFLLHSKVKSLQGTKVNFFPLKSTSVNTNCNLIREQAPTQFTRLLCLKNLFLCLDQINAKRMVNRVVRIFHFLGRKVQIWLKVTFPDRMKRNLGLKYFLQVKRGYFKNKAIAVVGELKWGRPRNCWFWTSTEGIPLFLLFGKKGNSNRLGFNVVA